MPFPNRPMCAGTSYIGSGPRAYRRESRITSYNVCYTKLLRVLSVAGGRLESGISFGLAALAPPVILMGFALAITRRDPPNPAPAIRRTLTLGLGVMAAAAAYIISTGLVAGRANPTVV